MCLAKVHSLEMVLLPFLNQKYWQTTVAQKPNKATLYNNCLMHKHCYSYFFTFFIVKKCCMFRELLRSDGVLQKKRITRIFGITLQPGRSIMFCIRMKVNIRLLQLLHILSKEKSDKIFSNGSYFN